MTVVLLAGTALALSVERGAAKGLSCPKLLLLVSGIVLLVQIEPLVGLRPIGPIMPITPSPIPGMRAPIKMQINRTASCRKIIVVILRSGTH